jgi:hypothetical protein
VALNIAHYNEKLKPRIVPNAETGCQKVLGSVHPHTAAHYSQILTNSIELSTTREATRC